MLYMVHGQQTLQAKLTLYVSQNGDHLARKARFKSAAVELFKALGHEAPDEIKQGFRDIDSQPWATLSPTVVDASFGHIELIPSDDWSIELTVEGKLN